MLRRIAAAGAFALACYAGLRALGALVAPDALLAIMWAGGCWLWAALALRWSQGRHHHHHHQRRIGE